VLIQSLLLASTGLLAIGSMTLVTLLLLSDQGWRNGLGYALGYISGYSVIGVSIVIVGYRATAGSDGEPGRWTSLLLMALGALLLWLAWRNWRRPASPGQEEPRFFTILNRITPPKAFAFGALVTVINVKNLALFLTALSVVIVSDLPPAQKIFITLLVALVFSLSVMIPLIITFAFPRRSRDLLNRLKNALERHSRPFGIWAPLIFGLIFLLKGISAWL
jgi:threonine/homoserine/homoserine lactone efflux protein